MKIILASVLALGLSGCARIAAIEGGISAVEQKAGASLLRINTRLVAANPDMTYWASQCATALGYVETIGAATGLLSAKTLDRARVAHDACQSTAVNPPRSLADIARKIATALTVIQDSAKVPSK